MGFLLLIEMLVNSLHFFIDPFQILYAGTFWIKSQWSPKILIRSTSLDICTIVKILIFNILSFSDVICRARAFTFDTFNSLWRSDAIWWHRAGSTLSQVIYGLLPDGCKPLPRPVLTNHQWALVAFTWWQFRRKSFTMIAYECHVVWNHQSYDCLIVYAGPHQRNIKVCITGPLWGKFSVDRWIPRTKGQQHGKSFHVMTS